MKIKALKLGLCLFALATFFISCEEEDDSPTVIETRDRTEQQMADSDSLIDFLSTHYYNSSFFETGLDHKYTDIIITELPQDPDTGEYLDMPDPDNNTLLIDAVGAPRTTTYFDTEYEYYVLNLNQGGGDSPKFTDRVSVRYEGTSVTTDEIFDVIATPQVLNLQGNFISTSGVIKAWQLVIPEFNSASDFSIGNDGIVNYGDFGLGVMFVPSGLGYFSNSTTGAQYDNLIFKFELLRFEEEDHDGDGIPSYIEDLDDDLDVSNDDTDDNDFPDFIDLDDDGDGVATFDELIQTTYTEEPVLGANEYIYSRDDETGEVITVTAVDANDNGILDYLDETATTNYNEEESN